MSRLAAAWYNAVMPTSPADQRAHFRRLHEQGCFVMPNPWDVGSARWLERLGFPALATTSSGSAWAQARPDGGLELDEVLDHLTDMAAAVEVPLNADFMHGFAADADGVGRNVALAVATGVAGLSIEDSTGDPARPLFGVEAAVDRIRAARCAIDESGPGVVLTGRSEGFLVGRPDLKETITRLVAYAEAGADCLYAPGVNGTAEVAEIVKAVAPRPVNVLVGAPGPDGERPGPGRRAPDQHRRRPGAGRLWRDGPGGPGDARSTGPSAVSPAGCRSRSWSGRLRK